MKKINEMPKLFAFVCTVFFLSLNSQIIKAQTCGPVGRITGTFTNVGWSKDFVILKKIILTSGTLDSLGIAVASSMVSKVVLYSNNAGNPDQLLAQTASSTLVIGTNVLDVSNISITAGDYWIGAIGQTNISFNTNGAGLVVKYFSLPYATALPTTAPALTSFSLRELDIWPVICVSTPASSSITFTAKNNVVITNGDITPSITDSTDFGSVVTGSSKIYSYKIKNTGTDTLKFTGSPRINITGANASEFTVVNQPPAFLKIGDSTILQVKFSPSSVGVKSATITFSNNTPSTNPFSFSIKGTAVSSSTCGPIGRITGTTTNVGWSKDFVILKKITLTSGTLDSLGIAVASSVVSKVVLYSDNAGNPDQLLAQTASSTLVIGTNVLDVSNISITAGDYWIGAIGQTSISFNTNLNSLSAKYFSWPYATALPTTAPSISNIAVREIDIWPIICTVSSPCNLTSALPTTAGTYTATQVNKVGTYNCYCDADGKLLLALDTNGTRAIISKDSVRLQIGSPSPTMWSNNGGIITNPDGGVIFNRKWDVAPTSQPTSPVKVKFFFTKAEYDSTVLKATLLGTTITAPNQLQMYKLTTSGFGDPHASGATGTILLHAGTPSLTTWLYAPAGSNHSAEFLVNSFSGGGGGAGASAIPLPVEFINFTAKGLNNNSAILNWQTASHTGKSYFEIERSFDGKAFTTIGTMNSNATGIYQYIDNGIKAGTSKAFYRITQMDENNESSETQIQWVQFNLQVSGINVYPNPATTAININIASLYEGDVADIAVVDALGKVVLKQSTDQPSIEINLSSVSPGIYQLVVNTKTENKTIQLLKY